MCEYMAKWLFQPFGASKFESWMSRSPPLIYELKHMEVGG
jgi:hypothetical protein